MRPVARHAVYGDAVTTELGPAHAAVLALPAALVVVVHHARADGREVRGHAGPRRLHHSARLMPCDDGPAAAQTQGGRGVARSAIGMQIASAHARGLDGDDDLTRTRRGIGKFLDLELPLSEKDDAAHVVALPCVSWMPTAVAYHQPSGPCTVGTIDSGASRPQNTSRRSAMESMVRSVLWIHVLAGSVALVVAPVALLTAKGGEPHRRWGKVYFLAMAVVASTALVVGYWRSILFLELVAVFSFYAALAGYRVLSRKRPDLGQRPR